MKKVAILFDGAYFSIVFKAVKKRPPSPEEIIALSQKIAGTDDLFRVYYYDCPPYEPEEGKEPVNPIDKKPFHSSKNFIESRKLFLSSLAKKDYIALRLGTLTCQGWKLSRDVHEQIMKGNLQKEIKGSHFKLDFKQKGVDMRIGLDMAHLSTKRIVDKIAIVTGDTDFIPVMKYARKEGILITLVNLKGHLEPVDGVYQEMLKHADRTLVINLLEI